MDSRQKERLLLAEIKALQNKNKMLVELCDRVISCWEQDQPKIVAENARNLLRTIVK